MKNFALLLSIILFVPALMPPADPGHDDQKSGISLDLTWEPQDPVNGSPFLFRVKPSRELVSLTGQWNDRRVFFDFDRASGTWFGLAGVGIDTAPGRQSLVLNGKLSSGPSVSSTHEINVGKGNYRKIALIVAQKYTEPDAETLVRIRQEQALKKEAFSRISQSRFWSGNFTIPIKDVITGQFGTERTFNRKRQSVHQGMDLRAAVGTPVTAMNSGEVVLAHEMFYEGGFVVIDHGYGLMTLYMHLSEIRLKAGVRIGRGEVVGLSGDTGRVTAPHLHVAVRWQGLYLDPQTLLKMSLII